MSTTKKIAHNTALQLSGKVISTVLGLLAVAIMTRALGVEKFGWYITAAGFLQFVGIFSDFGFTVVTANLLAEPRFDKKKLLNNLFTWRFLTGLFFNGLSPLIIWFFPYPLEIKLAVAILAVAFFSISLNQIFIGYYQSRLQMFVQTAGEVLSRVVLVIGLLLMSRQQLGFLPMMVVVTLAAMTYTVYLWRGSEGVRFQINRDISRAIFKKIWPVAVAVIFNSLYLQGDKVILPLYVSQTDMGLYGAAYRVLDIVTQTAAMIMGILTPLVTYAWSRSLKDRFKKYYQISFDIMALLMLPMIAGIMALATPIMKLIAGAEFGGSGAILAALSLAILGIILGMTFGHLALAIDRQRQTMWAYITAAIMAVVGYLVFIPSYGVWGAVGVSIAAELWAGLALLFIVCRYARFWPRLKTLAKIVAASAIMGVVVAQFQNLNVVLAIILGVVVYGGLILALKVVSKNTWREIASSRKSQVA